jgi:nucleoporin NUP42
MPRSDPEPSFNLDAKVIVNDLRNDRPLWPFSAYGPGSNPPRQLISGEVEQSAEEMRLLYYLAKSRSNENQAVSSWPSRDT